MRAQYNRDAEQAQQENAGAAAGAGAGPSTAAGTGPAQAAAPSHPVLAIRAKPSQQKAACAKPAARTTAASWPGCTGTVLPDPVSCWRRWVGTAPCVDFVSCLNVPFLHPAAAHR